MPDPLWHLDLSVSPYAYCRNNPLIIIDPNGMRIVNSNDSLSQEIQSEMSDEDKTYYQNLEEAGEDYEFMDVYNGYQIVKKARGYINKLDYAIGEEDLNISADCSGFVWAIIKDLGYNVGNRFDTSTMVGNSVFRVVGNWIEGSGSTDNYIWGDVLLWKGEHTGFFDPSPTSNIPGLNRKGTLLSARQGYGNVHYADPKWWTFGSGKMEAKGPVFILRGQK